MLKVSVKFGSLNMKKFSEICGWIGLILIHSASLPVIISLILGYPTELPPITMILLLWSGLFLFLIRSLYQRDKVYIVSNGLGFIFNTILLSFIILKNYTPMYTIM